ncbi:hypothetical protein H0H87_004207 [Tephrocybe sp. NHM501043]|nr:hypothetical protein H0H87_004207 [Tephrocybe sp. NHM501043]
MKCLVQLTQSSLLPVNYPLSFFIQLALLPGRVCLVAYNKFANPDSPVAFISASLQENPRVWELESPPLNEGSDTEVPLLHATPHIEILTLGVLPAYQQQGIARLLVKQVFSYFRDHSVTTCKLTDKTLVHTNVATSNIPALSFYERMGMKIATGVIRNLYRACPNSSQDGYLLIGRVAS